MNIENETFFCTERKWTQRTNHSFEKNGNEHENETFFWKERMPNPAPHSHHTHTTLTLLLHHTHTTLTPHHTSDTPLTPHHTHTTLTPLSHHSRTLSHHPHTTLTPHSHPGLGMHSFQKNATFLHSFEKNAALFAFFWKERCTLCVLLRSFENNAALFAFFNIFFVKHAALFDALESIYTHRSKNQKLLSRVLKFLKGGLTSKNFWSKWTPWCHPHCRVQKFELSSNISTKLKSYLKITLHAPYSELIDEKY